MSYRLHPTHLVAAATVLLLGLSACESPRHESPTPSGVPINMLSQNWQYMPGVIGQADGLHVGPTDFRIVEQDGSGGQPNPPLNLYGTHLETTGDFSVRTVFMHVNGDASLQLYDKPPVIADEFRIEPASISLTERGSDLEVSVWNDSPQGTVTNPTPVFDKHVAVTDPSASLTITRSGNSLDVSVGKSTVVSTDQGGIFSSGSLWFGLASQRGNFTVSSLSAQALHGGKLAAIDASRQRTAIDPDGLQALARKVRPDFYVGAAAALGPLTSDEQYQREIADFGSITLENAMKPQVISPQEGVYDFAQADAIIATAHKNGQIVHGHTLAFSEAMAPWMRNLPTGTPAERQASAAKLLQYLSTVMTHFKGQFDSLDVVNEPLDTDDGTSLQQNVWYRVFGPDYPVVVSQAVYAVDPHVKQFVNENGADMPGPRQEALRQFTSDANAKGAHFYGVGLQAHVYDMSTDAITADGLNATIDAFGASNLRVRISENDVTDDSGVNAQANQYATVFKTCLSNPNCVSYTTWGVDDRYDWFIDDDGSLQQGHDLLFNDGQPTAAYAAIKKALAR